MVNILTILNKNSFRSYCAACISKDNALYSGYTTG